MDLDELQSVQSRERQTDSLQQLRETFYRDAAEYIEKLRQKREHAAEEADDPWNSPEITRLSDDIDTAEGTVEAIYERRVGKIVKMASLAAADMPTEDEGLTDEERQLFETLVGSIEQNRDRVFAILDGEDPADVPELGAADGDAGVPSAGDAAADDEPPVPDDAGPTEVPPDRAPPAQEPDPAASAESDSPSGADDSGEPAVDAADLMGGDGPEAGESDAAPDRETPSKTGASPADPESPRSDESGPEREPGPGDDPSERTDGGDAPAVDRATVRITADVGEIFGVDQRAYDLNTEDVVTLPEANAGPLVERDAAERLD